MTNRESVNRTDSHTIRTGAFTLIELLVVISIVALLSSVVLASLNTARERARIAAAQSFATSLYHSVASEAGGYWKFDEGNGSTVFDASGNGLNGTINGATYVTDTPSGTGYALLLDNTDSVSIPTGGKSDYEKITESSFTMAAWFKVSDVVANPYGGGYILMRAGYNWMGLVIANNGTFSGAVAFSDDTYGNVGSNIHIDDGKWHHLAMSVNDSAKTMILFIDGKQVATSAYTKTLKSYTSVSPYYIGGRTDGNVHGTVDDVVFFGGAFK